MTAQESAAKFKASFKKIVGQEVNLTASTLLAVWFSCDDDGNGYIENEELDQFLKEFVTSVCQTNASDEVLSEAMMKELKQDFMDAYDENGDGKIEIREIWKKYDRDSNNSIDANELKSFLRDLIEADSTKEKVSDDKLSEYASSIIQIFDENKDGKLQIHEMARLLPVRENTVKTVLSSNLLKDAKKVNPDDIHRIFEAYDADKSGELEGDEINGFAKDFMELLKPIYTASDVDNFKEMLLKTCDLDGDRKISKEELTMFLLGLHHFQKQMK